MTAVQELKVEREMRDTDRQRVAELEQQLIAGDGDPDEAQQQLMERVEGALSELKEERLQRDADRHRVTAIEKQMAEEQAELAALRAKMAQDEEQVQTYRLGVSAREDELSTLQMKLAQREMDLTRVRDEVEIEQHSVSSQMEQLGSGREKLKSDWQHLDVERDKLVTQNHDVSKQARDLAQRLEEAIEQLQLERRAREADRSQLYEVESRFEEGQLQLQKMRQQLSAERQKLVARQRKLVQKETEIKGASKSLQANREGLHSQITVMTGRIERLLSERDDLDVRQKELTQQLSETDDDHLKERLQMALEELQYEQRARHLERQQLAAMVQQFSHVRQQLSQEEGRFQNSVDNSSDDSFDREQTIDLEFDFDEALADETVGTVDDSAGQETESSRLEGRVEEIEAEVESLRHERDDLAVQREEMEEAMAALLEEASADQDDPWIVDSAETDAAEVVVAEAEDVVEDDESAAELSADAEAAQEADNGEGHSIEEPAIIQEPSWARNVTPDGPKVDRASARSDETESANESDGRHPKNRDMARRMAMTSLREVANQSARNALAEHTQRKLKRKMWIDGSLACISMGLGGAFLSQNFDQPLSWKTYGGVAVIIGVITIVEMFRTFIRWQRATSMRKSGARRTRRPSFEDRYDRQTRESQDSHTAPCRDTRSIRTSPKPARLKLLRMRIRRQQTCTCDRT